VLRPGAPVSGASRDAPRAGLAPTVKNVAMSAPMSVPYRIVMLVATPIVRWWGRLQVVGVQTVPTSGPLLILCNHDSYWDPVVIGVAGMKRRQIRALAKAELWNNPILARVLNGMGQIPIERGRADSAALEAAAEALRQGSCVGVFPEGTTSRGLITRPLSGAARLAITVPDTHILLARVTGCVDIARFPTRPRLRVEFFEPAKGQRHEGESAIVLTRRTMTEVRAGAPYAVSGRRKKAAALQVLVDAQNAEADRKGAQKRKT
jgi:1-acyl-sn-glycerol-3-phosphate acyltransferase